MTALYSIYRSQRFDDLVGQEAAVRTLKNALVSERVAHAYLFTGIRGTGKTSTARILAKAVNCLEPSEGEPCNKCVACVAVNEASATDLIEIDAASNRGVDEIRDLREKAKYLPALLRRKVYIIDEAHQLTPEAFNALLKTLEEPPGHVLFILCTTEAHKLPATIVSRTQRFDFRRISEADIAARLHHIAGKEALTTTADGLALIATMAHGSMRDAITMLDQLASAGVDGIDAETVRGQLGLVSAPELAALLAEAAGGDAGGVMRRLQQLGERGADMRQLANGLAEMARKAVLLSLGAAESEDLGLDSETTSRLTEVVGGAGRSFAAAAFEAALAASTEMKQTHDPRLLLELLLLRLASSQALGPGGGSQATASAAATPGRAAEGRAAAAAAPKAPIGRSAPVAAESAAVDPGATPVVVASAASAGERIPAVVAAGADGDGGAALADVVRRWPLLLDALRGSAPATRVRALLADALPLELEDDQLTIGFRFAMHSEKAQEPLHRQELENALHQVYGETYRLSFRVTGPAAVPAAGQVSTGPPPPVPEVATPAAATDPTAGSEDGSEAATLPVPVPGNGAANRGREGSGEGTVRAAQDILGARITDVRPRQRDSA